MTNDTTGYFDGKAIIPDQPLKLKIGQKLRVRIEIVDADEIEQIEGSIPELAKLAVERAYSEALASWRSILIAKDAQLVEVFPEGTSRVV